MSSKEHDGCLTKALILFNDSQCNALLWIVQEHTLWVDWLGSWGVKDIYIYIRYLKKTNVINMYQYMTNAYSTRLLGESFSRDGGDCWHSKHGKPVGTPVPPSQHSPGSTPTWRPEGVQLGGTGR